jgi:hypothetical protein
LSSFIQKDPLGFYESQITNLYTYSKNNPLSFVDPLGLADLRGGSYFDIENATGYFNDPLLLFYERLAERIGSKLNMTEGFENKWAERHEIKESFITAEGDDFIFFYGHTFLGGGADNNGISAHKDFTLPGQYEMGPTFGISSGTPYRLNKMIRDLNANEGGPGILFFASCGSSEHIAKYLAGKTQTKLILGLSKESTGLGDPYAILKYFAKHADQNQNISIYIDRINKKLSKSNIKIDIFGDNRYKHMTFNSLLTCDDYPPIKG